MSFDALFSKILASWELLYLFKISLLVVVIFSLLLLILIYKFLEMRVTMTMIWLWWWCTKLVIWWWSPGNGCQMQGNLATYRQQSLSNAPSKAPCLFRLFPLCKYYFCIEWIFEQIWTFNNNMEFNFCGPPRGHTIWFHNKSQLSTSSPSSATL